jgi:hypothetical protein
MDRNEVINAIIGRAGSPDIDSIANTLASVREKFSSLQEQAVSLLSAALTEEYDPFIERKLKQVDELGVATPDTIANSLVSSGQNWSRDSTAVTQGLQVAPHQTLMGLHLSATVAENGLRVRPRTS